MYNYENTRDDNSTNADTLEYFSNIAWKVATSSDKACSFLALFGNKDMADQKPPNIVGALC